MQTLTPVNFFSFQKTSILQIGPFPIHLHKGSHCCANKKIEIKHVLLAVAHFSRSLPCAQDESPDEARGESHDESRDHTANHQAGVLIASEEC